MASLFQAPPGTKLYERMKREGRLLPHLSGDNVDGTTNIIPLMGIDELCEGYRKIMGQIYSPKQFYQRVKTFLSEYRAPKIGIPFDFQRFLAVARSGLHLGILGSERFQYWKLMLWTALRRPGLLPLAVSFAIYGHHYRRICELYIL